MKDPLEPFFGRSEELKRLVAINRKQTASLVVCLGRRRIGKSRLIQEFGKKFDRFIEIQGLPPRDGQTSQDQLDHFAKVLAAHFQIPALTLKDWSEAFYALSRETAQKRCLVFLDEISWMGEHAPDFPGKLKIAWDTQFKKNPHLCMVLCGSISSWIQKNILASTDFLGRISLDLHLLELPLKDAKNFWLKEDRHLSELDKLRFLCLTGGVPRYLEEINFKDSFRENVQALCFQKDALFLDEFQRIFSDIFGKRSASYRAIVESLLPAPLTAAEISRKTVKTHNGKLDDYLKDLELSGFIRGETGWDLKTKKSAKRKIHYRISDCYLRFYLKFLSPHQTKIKKGLFKTKNIEELPSWDIFVGLQFEALILNNLDGVLQCLGLDSAIVENAGSFFQPTTTRSQGCQIDLLIQTRNTLYVCELKARREIDTSVINEVKAKIRKLKYPKSLTIKPVLITAGVVDPEIANEDFFSKVISLNDIIKTP